MLAVWWETDQIIFVLLSAASIVPHRKSDFSKVVVSAFFTGACVSLINACVAGRYLSLVSWQKSLT